MSLHTHGRAQNALPIRAGRASRLGLALLLSLALGMVAAPAALGQFGVKKLRLGSASGAEDYLYTAGNTVVEQGTVDRARYYRFNVYDASGSVRWTSSCRPSPANRTVTGSYTLQSSDPLSDATAWRFRLREFSNASSCNSSSGGANDASLYFDVATAKSYASSALTNLQSAFGTSATGYVQVLGAGAVQSSATNTAQGVGSWRTTWLLPSGATACANTQNTAGDLPGSTTAGQLPDATAAPLPAKPELQYPPSPTVNPDSWNLLSNYETRPCPSIGGTNQGQWRLKLTRDTTHFVTLPVFTADTTAPDTTLTSGPSSVIASSSATFTFISSEPGSSFQCSLDGAPPSVCSSPQVYTGLSSGAHTFSVQAIDAAGNIDPTPASSSWTVTPTAPSVTLTTPTAGSYTNSTATALGGTAQTAPGDSAVGIKIYAGTSATGAPVQSLSTAVQSGGSWTVSATTLPDGTYTAEAQQTDGASQTGYSNQVTFTVDTTAPLVTVSAPAAGAHTNDAAPTITGTAGTAPGDLPTVTVTITGGGAPIQATASASPSGTWTVVLPSSLAEGNYVLRATQQDQAGNTGASDSRPLTIDTTPPQTVLDAAPVGTTSSTTASFSFHATDALSQGGSTFQCQIDGGSWGPCSSPMSYYNLAPGSHSFSVEAIDGAGNLDNSGQTATWTIDTTLPAVALTSPADGSFTNDTTPTLSGTAGTAPGDSSTIRVLIFSNTDLTGSPVQTLSATVAADGSWSATPTVLPNGTYVAYAQQSGTAGTATSAVHTFTVDTAPPATTITLAPPGSSGTGDAGFSFSSSGPGATFQCQLDGGAWTACSSPQRYSGLGSGSHTFEVRATDAAGNVGTPASQTWSVNPSLPTLSLSAPTDASTTNDRTLAIAGTGGHASGDASTVTVKIYAGTTIVGSPVQTITTSVASSTGAWVAHPGSGLADGTYSVYAQQAGSAGTAYTSANTFTVDTTPPSTTITSGPQGTTSATDARFVFASSEPGSSFECQLDGGSWSACGSPQSYTGLDLGAHAFSVRAIDAAGNVDPNPAAATWTVDTAATVPVTLTSPADGTTTSDTTPTFSGAAGASDGAISLEIDDAGGNPVETLTPATGNSWSATATPALPDGTYTAFASQLSAGGTTTYYSGVIRFTVDTAPPVVTLTSGPAGATNNPTPVFGGSAGTAAGDAGTVTLKIYSGKSATGTPVQTLTAMPSGGSWSSTATALQDGTYTARAQQSDAAGNTGTSSDRTFILDVAPHTQITLDPPASTTSTTATFSFTASKPGSTFECRIDVAAWTACSSPQTYTGLALGAHAFAVRATDPAGTVDPTPASAAWTVTPTPPPGRPAQHGTPRPATLRPTLTAKFTQHFARRARVTVYARASRAGSLVLSGRLAITIRAKRGARSKSSTVVLGRMVVVRMKTSKPIKLTINLPVRAQKIILRALAKKRRVTLTLSGVVSARGIKPGAARITIRLVS